MNVTALMGMTAEQLSEVELNVDPAEFHTILPEKLACSLGITTSLNAPILAGGPPVNAGLAYLKLVGREGAVPVVMTSEGHPTLGFSSLQCLGLKVNEETESLELDRPYGPALMGVQANA